MNQLVINLPRISGNDNPGPATRSSSKCASAVEVLVLEIISDEKHTIRKLLYTHM